jgi:hypothetical protein
MVVYHCYPSYSGGRGKRIASLGPIWKKLERYNLKNKIQTKGLEAQLKWYSSCLASLRSWVHSSGKTTQKVTVLQRGRLHLH